MERPRPPSGRAFPSTDYLRFGCRSLTIVGGQYRILDALLLDKPYFAREQITTFVMLAIRALLVPIWFMVREIRPQARFRTVHRSFEHCRPVPRAARPLREAGAARRRAALARVRQRHDLSFDDRQVSGQRRGPVFVAGGTDRRGPWPHQYRQDPFCYREDACAPLGNDRPSPQASGPRSL